MRISLLILIASAGVCFGQIAPPTEFRLDPSDFFNDASRNAVYLQFRWTIAATNATGQRMDVSTNGTDFFSAANIPTNQPGIDTLYVPWTSNRWYRLVTFNGSDPDVYTPTQHVVGNMPPSHLGGTSAATNVMTVNWDTAGGYLTGYKVQQATDTNFSAGLTNYTVTGITNNHYSITNSFTLNTTYYFRVLSTSVGGDSEAMNKPRAYIACAPDGPPETPTFVTIYTTAVTTNDSFHQVPTETITAFDNNALNQTGYKIEHSLDSNTWTTVGAFVGVEGARQTFNDENLLPGQKYYYRLAATNANGPSAWTQYQIVIPNVAPSGITSWYIDNQATGDASGMDWTNAWPSLGAINWVRVRPGHTIYISGGTNSQTYQDYLTAPVDGAVNSPITFKLGLESGHHGKVIINGQIAISGRSVTIDGAKNPGWSDFYPLESMTNNIGIKVVGRGDIQQCVNSTRCYLLKIKWLELTGSGNPEAPDSLVTMELNSGGLGGPYQSEVSYCWIHENYGSGLSYISSAGYQDGFGRLAIHHNIVERNGNNFLGMSGYADIYANILRETGIPIAGNPSSTAHPDGLQGGFVNTRIWGNMIGNSAGTTLYASFSAPFVGTPVTNAGVGGSYTVTTTNKGFLTNMYLLNNVFYKTKSVGSTGLVFDSEGNDAGSSQVIDTGGGIFMTNIVVVDFLVSNMVWCGNTFYATNVEGLAINCAHKLADNTVVRGRAIRVENNLIYSGPATSPAAAAMVIGGQDWPTNETIVDWNIITGPQKIVFYSTDYFATAEALSAATPWTHNRSTMPAFMDTNDFLLSPLYSETNYDTVALGGGTNLSVLASELAIATNDLWMNVRGTAGAWNIGAIEQRTNNDSRLAMKLSFEDDFYSATNKFAVDVSGSGRDGLRYGRPATRINYPTLTNSHNASQAAKFRVYTNDTQAGQPQYFTGDYIAVTNLGNLASMTNATFSAWVKYYGGNEDADSTIMGGGGANDVGEWQFGRFGHARTQFTVSTNTLIPDDKYLKFPDTGLSNEWHHYTITWDGNAHTAIAYFDAVPVETNTVASNVWALKINGQYMGIGCWTFDGEPFIQPTAEGGVDNYPNTGWINGALDGIQVYRRTLNQANVSRVYQGLNTVPDFNTGANDPQPPLVTVSPESSTNHTGDNVLLSVVATGDAPLSYQWRVNSNNIVSATLASYQITGATTNDSGYYDCVVTNVVGATTSSVARVVVRAPATLWVHETFEGANSGFDNTGWTVSGGADPNYTTHVLQGIESFNGGSGYAFRSVPGGDSGEMWLRMRVWMVSPPSGNQAIMLLFDGAEYPFILFSDSSGQLYVSQGGATASTKTPPLIAGTNWVWLHYLPSSGANDGVASVATSTNGVQPAPQSYTVIGNNSAAPTQLYLFGADTGVVAMDDVQVTSSSDGIGNDVPSGNSTNLYYVASDGTNAAGTGLVNGMGTPGNPYTGDLEAIWAAIKLLSSSNTLVIGAGVFWVTCATNSSMHAIPSGSTWIGNGMESTILRYDTNFVSGLGQPMFTGGGGCTWRDMRIDANTLNGADVTWSQDGFNCFSSGNRFISLHLTNNTGHWPAGLEGFPFLLGAGSGYTDNQVINCTVDGFRGNYGKMIGLSSGGLITGCTVTMPTVYDTNADSTINHLGAYAAGNPAGGVVISNTSVGGTFGFYTDAGWDATNLVVAWNDLRSARAGIDISKAGGGVYGVFCTNNIIVIDPHGIVAYKTGIKINPGIALSNAVASGNSISFAYATNLTGVQGIALSSDGTTCNGVVTNNTTDINMYIVIDVAGFATTITKSGANGQIDARTTCGSSTLDLWATAPNGYNFIGWTTSSSNPYAKTVTGTSAEAATFAAQQSLSPGVTRISGATIRGTVVR